MVAACRILVASSVLIACGSSDDIEKGGTSQSALGSSDLVIRQVYARSAGGSTPGTFSREFVEIFNRGTAAASLSGLTLQAAGSGTFLKSVVLPPVSIPPGKT